MDPREQIVASYRPIDRLLPPRWTAGDIRANGITQHYYRTGGAKPPLVLLHGILEGALAWLRAARAFESDFDVVMLDARGHGGSDRVGDAGFAPDALGDDVVAAVGELRLGAVNLLGFSLGATTAVLAANRTPTLVGRLVLVGMPDRPAAQGNLTDSPGYRVWLDRYRAWLEALRPAGHPSRLIAALSQLPPSVPLPPEDDYVGWVENSARLDAALLDLSDRLWGEQADTRERVRHALEAIDCPTLILKSAMTAQSDGPLTIRPEPSQRPNVQVLRFENTGHLVVRDRFDAFVAEVRRFLLSE